MKKNENDSIIKIVDYGVVEFDLTEQMKKRNFDKETLRNKTGLDPKIINRYVDGSVTRLNMDVLSKFCYVLNCDLSDILTYKASSKK